MNFPGSVLVKPDGTNGLTQSSVFMVHQLGAVELSIIASKIGHLSSADIEAVEQSIIRLVDLGVSPPAALPSSINDEKDSNAG